MPDETPTTDPVMDRAKELFQRSGMSLEELGRKMGYDDGAARRSAWQFLNKTNDPRLSMLRRFALAVGVDVQELFKP
jgi:transcriptional regulator with XRE-family HTH domain